MGDTHFLQNRIMHVLRETSHVLKKNYEQYSKGKVQGPSKTAALHDFKSSIELNANALQLADCHELCMVTFGHADSYNNLACIGWH